MYKRQNQDKRRIDLEIGVSYDADLQQVRHVLQEIIKDQEEILAGEMCIRDRLGREVMNVFDHYK